jgi:hypothetical protein
VKKILLIVFLLFLATMLTVFVGYYNTLVGFDLIAIKWVIEEIPIFKASLFLALSCPLYLIVAFYTSKGDFQVFKSETIGLSIITPFIMILLFLPGATDVPDHLGKHIDVLLISNIVIQYFAGKSLLEVVWELGGRENEI